MRCQRCEFENMPGLETCMRCGSVLGSSAEPVDIHPPRMSRWKKPIRNFFRRLRQFMPIAAWSGDDLHSRHFPDWIRKASRVAFFGAILSFIPGLAHIIQRRFHTIRWWVAAWLIMLLIGLFFYGSPIGLIITGLAIAIHVWIAVHSALLAEYSAFNYRFVGYLIILVFFYILYMAFARLIFFNWRGGYSIVDVPYAQIHRGDFLLGRVNQADPNDILRGDFVLVQLERVRNYINPFDRWENSSYVQIIGLGGDTVAIKNDQFVVNDEVLDSEQFPVQGWLKSREFSSVLPEGTYFISAQYQGRGYNDAQIIEVCVIDHEQVVARAFLRWNPLRRRGFIEEY